MNKKYKKGEKGFTLIELLVVISIIGILAALSLVSFTSIQKQARDTQRKSDIKQYQNSLEIFANKNSSLYPSRSTSEGASVVSVLCTDLSLASCKEDPRFAEDNTQVYRYQSDGSDNGTVDATNYVLWAKMESKAEYYIVCSNGKVGSLASVSVTLGACPI